MPPLLLYEKFGLDLCCKAVLLDYAECGSLSVDLLI